MGRIVALGLLLGACAAAPTPPGVAPAEERRPLVIAHRGASGERPEHTLEAYRLAIEQGADFIEIDVVATRDGQLIARHENELSQSTDIAARPRFAARRTTKRVQGSELSGWFSEDLTLAEIQSLRAIERWPKDRPDSALHDGRHPVASLAQIIQLLRRTERESGRLVGLDLEIKQATWFAKEGTHLDGARIGLSIPRLLVDTLVAEAFTDPSRIFIQAFEVEPLLELQRDLLPAAGLDLPLLQLLGNLGDPAEPFNAPYDFRYNARERLEPYGELARCLGAPIGSWGYATLVSTRGLGCMQRLYAEGIAARKQNVLLDTQPGREVAGWVEAARRRGLFVHIWTLRAEERFRSLRADGGRLSLEDEVQRLLALGADALITDHPARVVAARDAHLGVAD